jgi:UPF0755 protein
MRTPRERRSHSSSSTGGSYWLIGVITLVVFFLYYFFSSTGSVLVPKGTYRIDTGMVFSTLNDELSLGIGPTRYKVWLSFFAPKLPNLQVWEYRTDTPMRLSEFLTSTLKKPVHSDITITILPGWNMYDIDAYLASKNISKIGEFISAATINFRLYQEKYKFLTWVNSLEGFLYGDTYRIAKSAWATEIIDVMLREFDKKIGESYIAQWSTAYQKLILASIVEREERVLAVKPIVAGILAKRITEGIAIGADATVCTGYAKTQKECTPEFIGSVIGDEHPYNTRRKRGYPPTPISNITENSWSAAVSPESSPYYYYLHDSDGRIHYGRTLDEHNVNKNKYIQ